MITLLYRSTSFTSQKTHIASIILTKIIFRVDGQGQAKESRKATNKTYYTLNIHIHTMTDTALQDRIFALERTHYKCPPEVEIVDESMRRARTEIETLGLYSSRWMYVIYIYN
jgi:hypothetical protein